MAWAGRSHELEWYRFAYRATPRQFALFGFPAAQVTRTGPKPPSTARPNGTPG